MHLLCLNANTCGPLNIASIVNTFNTFNIKRIAFLLRNARYRAGADFAGVYNVNWKKLNKCNAKREKN
ncbi:hypothetical protein GGTG_05707 [Gaeumannomyces tritici R3-111a-1]|uniref:Uncharacterized protein n=1 Tax=Gaeumannomyces tritici (strain R3-111a-1) TaxID=644352 RepID=J3NWP5_GAET3|nr:hypothetical protein GGTG_05707 [Gaeumannomyces tritici R3-111a-1]EJT75777.1 hypothetical protein GGTG_05707 [Gaeumannomyces tritici R3-111a-1]